MDRDALTLILPVLGKLLYTYPDTGFLERVKTAGLFEEMPYEGDETFSKGMELLTKWQHSDGGYNKCIADYQDLFVGVRGSVKTPAWESVYVAPSPTMFGECTLKVRMWYDRYGMEIKNIRHEPDDHMGIELMFLAHLLTREPESAERFFAEHIGRWYKKFFDSMAAQAVTPLYRGLALTLKSICGDIDQSITAAQTVTLKNS